MQTYAHLLRSKVARRLIAVRAVSMALALSGCVSGTSYEQAVSATEVEQEAHRRTQARLTEAESKLAELSTKEKQLSRDLEGEEQKLAERELELTSTKAARDQEAELSEQLRGELARVGDHLKVYAGEKDQLAARLAASEKREAALEAEIAARSEEIDQLEKNVEAGLLLRSELERARAKIGELEAAPADEAGEPPAVDDSADAPEAADDGAPDSPPAE